MACREQMHIERREAIPPVHHMNNGVMMSVISSQVTNIIAPLPTNGQGEEVGVEVSFLF